MEKPNISRLPTSQMMKFLQVFGLPQEAELGGKESMISALETVPDETWDETEVEFVVDQI